METPMIAQKTPTIQHGTTGAPGPIGKAIHALFHALAESHKKHTTLAVLSRLSDRELDDIGLTREDLKRMT